MNHSRHSDHPYHPTGVALPALLRRTLPSEVATTAAPAPAPAVPPHVAPEDDSWSTDDVQRHLNHLSQSLQLIQKQIQRGEECYAEEASTHSIYKGWDGFIDARPTPDASATTHVPGMQGPPRRLTADHRWFSTSFNVTQVVTPSTGSPMGHFAPPVTVVPSRILASTIPKAFTKPNAKVHAKAPASPTRTLVSENPKPTKVTASTPTLEQTKSKAKSKANPNAATPEPPTEKTEVVASVPRKAKAKASVTTATPAPPIEPTSAKRKAAAPVEPVVPRRTTKRRKGK